MSDSESFSAASTKERLVIKAAELLQRQSFDTVSVEDICRATDIKKGTFYHHFPSKADLASAAYAWMWQQFKAKLDICFAPDAPPLARLRRYADGAYRFHKEQHERGESCGCPLSSAGHEMQDAGVAAAIRERLDHHAGYFEALMAEIRPDLAAADAAARGRDLFSFAMGVFYEAKAANDPEVIARLLLPGLVRLSGLDERQGMQIRSVKHA